MAIYFMHYNFVRLHQTLEVTPAMAAGVTSRLWEMSDMVRALEDWEAAMTDKLSSETQKLAIRLIHQLAAIKKMPLVAVRLLPANKSRPIVITPVPNPTGNYHDITVWQFLSLDIETAIAKGGTFADLVQSKRLKRQWPPAWEMEPPDVETLDNAIGAFGLKIG